MAKCNQLTLLPFNGLMSAGVSPLQNELGILVPSRGSVLQTGVSFCPTMSCGHLFPLHSSTSLFITLSFHITSQFRDDVCDTCPGSFLYSSCSSMFHRHIRLLTWSQRHIVAVWELTSIPCLLSLQRQLPFLLADYSHFSVDVFILWYDAAEMREPVDKFQLGVSYVDRLGVWCRDDLCFLLGDM